MAESVNSDYNSLVTVGASDIVQEHNYSSWVQSERHCDNEIPMQYERFSDEYEHFSCLMKTSVQKQVK